MIYNTNFSKGNQKIDWFIYSLILTICQYVKGYFMPQVNDLCLSYVHGNIKCLFVS